MSDPRPIPADPVVPAAAETVPQPAAADATLPQPGGPAAPPPDVPADLRDHPRYRVLGLLGVGGMGAVYKAEHLKMGRPVALKTISPALTDRPGAVERFDREVRAAAALSHPNIVAAYDADQAGRLHFLIMEYVEGESLDRVVATRGPLPVAEACDAVRQAALGLQHAHDRGMVHRDVKPQNLMRTPDGRVKVLDFGLARFAGDAAAAGRTETGCVMGTPDYMAPEQALSTRRADGRADLYSLGCTLYFLLTGRPPFPGESITEKLLHHQQTQPRPVETLRPDVPPGLAAVVRTMMAKRPDDRFLTPAA